MLVYFERRAVHGFPGRHKAVGSDKPTPEGVQLTGGFTCWAETPEVDDNNITEMTMTMMRRRFMIRKKKVRRFFSKLKIR